MSSTIACHVLSIINFETEFESCLPSQEKVKIKHIDQLKIVSHYFLFILVLEYVVLANRETEIEKKINENIYAYQGIRNKKLETHLQKDNTYKVREYQCFRTDGGGDRRKGSIITLIKSNINAYMSSCSNDGPE